MVSTRTRLGDLIETALARQDIEKQALARHLDIKPASISKWLRQEQPDPVPPLHWEKITRYLSIPWKVWVEAAQADRPEDVQEYYKLKNSF